MRSGGVTRIAGILLAVATFGPLLAGPVIIGFIPVMVVGALIFFLGIDLLREALVNTWGTLHRLEYLTVSHRSLPRSFCFADLAQIVIIIVTMGAYDFVVGILVGIILACVSFVLQTSQISAIRGTMPGGVASSTVRRHPIQHRFLQEVGHQIYVMKLAGFLFFGTIVGVENRIRALLKDDAFESQPIQMLVIDLSKVDGLDFSAAEAFTRVNRILNVRNIRLIVCGFTTFGEVGKSLRTVGLLDEDGGANYFDDLNSALEFCENDLLKTFYQRRDMNDLDKSEPSPRCLGKVTTCLLFDSRPLNPSQISQPQIRGRFPRKVSTVPHAGASCTRLQRQPFRNSKIRHHTRSGKDTNNHCN